MSKVLITVEFTSNPRFKLVKVDGKLAYETQSDRDVEVSHIKSLLDNMDIDNVEVIAK